MQFQISTDYAIRILGYLHQHQTELATAPEMSKSIGVSYQFFMKVANRLKKIGLIKSVQGCKGGYRLAVSAEEISLYDVVTAMEGEIKINRCLRPDGECSRDAIPDCPVRQVLEDVQTSFISSLEAKTIAAIFDGGSCRPSADGKLACAEVEAADETTVIAWVKEEAVSKQASKKKPKSVEALRENEEVLVFS